MAAGEGGDGGRGHGHGHGGEEKGSGLGGSRGTFLVQRTLGMNDLASRPMFGSGRAAQRSELEDELHGTLERPEALASLLFQADGGRDGTPRAGESPGGGGGGTRGAAHGSRTIGGAGIAGGRRRGHSRQRSLADSLSKTDATGNLNRLLARARARAGAGNGSGGATPSAPSMRRGRSQPNTPASIAGESMRG